MREKIFKSHPLGFMIGISALIMFACSSLRHALFHSSFDLRWYDQATYLISQGQPPILSVEGYHLLGDQVALVCYPLALLYKIYPDVHWLFAVQAIALALGALPTWHLARQAGLKEAQATAMAAVYLLYPLVFNVNLFDFHPEVIALPAFLGAVLAARLGQKWWFCLAIILILSCRAVLSLTVAAMGLWLLLFEKKRWYGAIALFAGIAWFLIATQVIIPSLSGKEAAAVGRYDFLGDSVLGIAKNLILKPGLVLGKIFTLTNLEYLVLLLFPLIWRLSPRHLTPLVAAIPALALNLVTDYQPQKDLTHHYSLPILPFLLLAVISTLAAGGGWLRSRRLIILWALIAFLALAKFGYFWSIYLERIDTWKAMREAVSLVPTKGSVLTSDYIAPHLTHRPVVKLALEGSESMDLSQFDYVLLNVRHRGMANSQEIAASLVDRLKQAPEFQLTYEQDEVFLFEKVN
ncbi:MAG: DUF2079 domain-containing protein [Xenococcaceae cyanobacterium]